LQVQLVNSSDSRMIKEAFQAAVLMNTDATTFDNFHVEGGIIIYQGRIGFSELVQYRIE